MRNLSVSSNYMALILLQSKFEAIRSKYVRGVAFSAEADVLNQIFGFCQNNVSPIAPMTLISKFLEIPVKRPV